MLVRGGIEMLTSDQWEALHAPFPPESLIADTSRGFELTSIKAAFVIERLNEVLGPCGIGWRYAHSPFETYDLKNGSQEIVTEVAVQYRLNGIQDGAGGCPPIEWCALTKGWSWREGSPAPLVRTDLRLWRQGCVQRWCTAHRRPRVRRHRWYHQSRLDAGCRARCHKGPRPHGQWTAV